MRAPIAQRRVTGARRIPRRRGPTAGPARLRRPLALLYRQPSKTHAAAAIRAADGRAVTLAPRLQIALHLSFSLNAQHPAREAATAPPRLETARRASGEARIGSPLSFVQAARENADGASRHERFVHGRSAFRYGARSSGRREQGFSAPATNADRGRPVFIRPGTQPAGAAARNARGLRHREMRTSARIGVSASASRAAGGAHAAASGRIFRRPDEPASHALPRPRTDTMPAQRRATMPSAGTFAHGGAAPLYLAGRSAGRSAAADSFDPAWAPPPLVYRSPAAPPPAPASQPDARPAPAAPPSTPSVDLDAVSRDVICRIEKRLRVERERRGRS